MMGVIINEGGQQLIRLLACVECRDVTVEVEPLINFEVRHTRYAGSVIIKQSPADYRKSNVRRS